MYWLTVPTSEMATKKNNNTGLLSGDIHIMDEFTKNRSIFRMYYMNVVMEIICMLAHTAPCDLMVRSPAETRDTQNPSSITFRQRDESNN